MAKKEQDKPEGIAKALVMGEKDLPHESFPLVTVSDLAGQALQPELVRTIVEERVAGFAEIVRKRALRSKTPKEVIEKVPGGKTKDGKELEFDYIKLGYLLNQLQNDYEIVHFEMIEPPHMCEIWRNGAQSTPPFVVCTMQLSLYKGGIKVKQFVAEGYRDIPVSKEGKFLGWRAAFVGCPTEAMRKLISLCGYGNDVYDYGLEDSVDVKIQWAIETFKEEFPAVLDDKRESNIREYLRRMSVPTGDLSASDNFKAAVNMVWDQLKKAQVKP